MARASLAEDLATQIGPDSVLIEEVKSLALSLDRAHLVRAEHNRPPVPLLFLDLDEARCVPGARFGECPFCYPRDLWIPLSHRVRIEARPL